MNMRAMTEFADAIRADAELAKGLVAALHGKHGREVSETLIAYARERGFAVREEEDDA